MIKGMITGAAALLIAAGSAIAAAAEPQPPRTTRDLYHWFTADDYPLEALRRRSEGMVGFRLTIDAEGAVSGCTVERSSGDPDLDRVTCEILRSRPRYYPARDAAGRAVEGLDTGTVTWRLPPEPDRPAPLTLATADLEGMIRMSGPQLACHTAVNGDARGATVVPLCSLLVGADGFTILRRTVAGTEFSATLSIRPGDSGSPAPPVRDRPILVAAATVTVRPDGSVSACTPLGEPARPPEGFVRLHGPCALFPVGAVPFFSADPARTEPRRARLELRYYLRPRQTLGPLQPLPSRPARANLASYFSSDDYPEPARLRRSEGTVAFRLVISPEGRVTECGVTQTSGDSSLDAATCTILRERARYAPARDAQQRPVPGTDHGRVTWRFPDGFERARLVPYRLVTRLSRAADGSLRCRVIENGVALPGEALGECGYLAGSGAGAWIGAPGGPSEITYVFALGPAEANIDSPGADEAGYGRLAGEVITSLSVAPTGRIADCRPVRRHEPLTLNMERLGDCDLADSDEEPYFERSGDSGPRRARMRLAIFVR